jgi:tetratricopeptide (TPR) repeat protein
MNKCLTRIRYAALIVWIFLICSGYTVQAEKTYDFNTTCQQAYQELISLKINSGKKIVTLARKQNPNNLIPDLLDSYADFLVLFFNEDAADYKRLKDQFDIRINRLAGGPKQSPYNKYSQSVVYIQKACVAVKFGEKWKAGWDFRKSFSLIKENRKSFPTFQPNNMIYGPMQVIAGTIPDSYKWLAGLFGIKGSINEGMNLLRTMLYGTDADARLFHTEAIFYYNYINFYIQNKQDDVFNFIQQQKPDLVNNHLMAYMAVNLGLNAKKNEYARSIITKRAITPDYLMTSTWDYEKGYIHLRHLEYKEAINHFSAFTKNFKGRFYLKDAYEKLSWAYYLQGNMAAAETARKQVLLNGHTETDADKQSMRDAQTGIWPHASLLKARLLNDGGYLQDALRLMESIEPEKLMTAVEKLEYQYRYARIYDDLKQYNLALIYYEKAIKTGETTTEYYASRAALQSGMIYELNGKKSTALQYYQKCLLMPNHPYKASIDQKAKAGIARCKGL